MKFRHFLLALFILAVGGVITLVRSVSAGENPVLAPLGLAWETMRRAGSVYSYGRPRLRVQYSDEERDTAEWAFEARRTALERVRTPTGGLLIDGTRAVTLRRTLGVGRREQSPYNPALVFVGLGPGPAAIYYLPARQGYAVLGRVRVEPYLEEVTDAILNRYGEPDRPLPVPRAISETANAGQTSAGTKSEIQNGGEAE